jgi:hypothetical protein
MDLICNDEIKTLLQRGPGTFVSIFMPTHHSGGADPQDPIRLKNLVRQAEERLIKTGMRGPEARVLMDPVRRLVQDNLFWRQQSEGLAIFLHDNLYLNYKVPTPVDELVIVDNHFHVQPLLSLLSACGWFYVLGLSQGEIKLLQCTEFSSVRINLEGVPKDLAESMQSEVPDAAGQHHFSSRVSGGAYGAGSTVQFGQGPKTNYTKNNIVQFFDKVNKGVSKILKEEKAPLVLAGVEFLLPLYEKANSYANVMSQKITGNVETWNDDVLRQEAWKTVKPYFDKARLEAMAQFDASAGTGLTATEIKEVITSAISGRVKFLFASKGIQKWGSLNKDTGEVSVHPRPQPGDEDLLDLAAFETLAHAGTVYVMNKEEVPGSSQLSALLRY